MDNIIYAKGKKGSMEQESPSSYWRLKPSVAQTKQFPLYFTNPPVDFISKTLTAFGNCQRERIIYMGPRFTSTNKMIKSYSFSPMRDENEVCDSPIFGVDQINKYKYEYNQRQKFFPVRSSQYRLFTGMNPTAKRDELRFDSNFECGNLDLAVSLGDNAYDLFMRVDSNTKGHTCWFFFKVTNFADQVTYRFNINNFSRSNLQYEQGMKVYTYCSSSNEWVQQGFNINFYHSQKCKYVENNENQESKLYTLSFDFQFKIEDEFVYFSYCIPYSYSFLQYSLLQIQEKYGSIVDIDRSNLSTGGLPIPLMTITNKSSKKEEEDQKTVCLIIGRLHPGQTQGSWILQGFINYLCSPRAKQLRSSVIFKIIPMVNVDGVIAGNFRTGLLGKDLNRYFHQPEQLNEIGLIRFIAFNYKPLMFLDFHGHSSKKNIFVYGPDYAIDNRYYLPCRLFSKLTSKCTKAFRYHACIFRVSSDKKAAGRAIMLRSHQVIYCFTVEASAFAYGSKRQETPFDKQEYLSAGSSICLGLDKFIKIIFSVPRKSELERQIEKIAQKNSSCKRANSSESELSDENAKLIQQIMNDEPSKLDKYNEEDSDFEQDNDYSERQLAKMLKGNAQASFQKKTKVGKRKNTKLSNQQSCKNYSLKSQKSIQLSGPKLTEPDEQVTLLPRRIMKSKYPRNLSTDGRNQSQSMHLNTQSFPQPQANTNKIRFNSKKLFSGQNCLILQDSPASKLHNFNPINLKYTMNKINSEYQPLSQMKKMKEKQSIILKRKTKEKEKLQSKIQIKHSLLPLLGMNGNMNKQQRKTLIDEILENHERSRKNRTRKQIKLYYY